MLWRAVTAGKLAAHGLVRLQWPSRSSLLKVAILRKFYLPDNCETRSDWLDREGQQGW